MDIVSFIILFSIIGTLTVLLLILLCADLCRILNDTLVRERSISNRIAPENKISLTPTPELIHINTLLNNTRTLDSIASLNSEEMREEMNKQDSPIRRATPFL